MRSDQIALPHGPLAEVVKLRVQAQVLVLPVRGGFFRACLFLRLGLLCLCVVLRLVLRLILCIVVHVLHLLFVHVFRVHGVPFRCGCARWGQTTCQTPARLRRCDKLSEDVDKGLDIAAKPLNFCQSNKRPVPSKTVTYLSS